MSVTRKNQELLQDCCRALGYGKAKLAIIQAPSATSLSPLTSTTQNKEYQMSKAVIPIAALIAAIIFSSSAAFAKGGGNGAAVGKPPGYTGQGGTGARVGKPPGYTGHGGTGAREGKPAVESQPKS